MSDKSKSNISVAEKESTKVERPKFYKVVILNDDYTSFDFVVRILMSIFRKTEPEARALTQEIHSKGSAIAGIYTFEIAETKSARALLEARQAEFPLLIEMEPE